MPSGRGWRPVLVVRSLLLTALLRCGLVFADPGDDLGGESPVIRGDRGRIFWERLAGFLAVRAIPQLLDPLGLAGGRVYGQFAGELAAGPSVLGQAFPGMDDRV